MPNPIALIGLDIAKSIFEVRGADNDGGPSMRCKLKRHELEDFFRARAPFFWSRSLCRQPLLATYDSKF